MITQFVTTFIDVQLCVCMFRARKVLETRNMGVEDQLSAQESQLRAVKDAAEERDRMYEEVMLPQSDHALALSNSI